MSGWQRQSSYTINNTTQDSIIINTRTTGPSDTENRIYSPATDQLWWNGSQIITATTGVDTLRAVGTFTITDANSEYTIQSTVLNGVIFSEDTGGITTEQIRISKTNTVGAPILSFSGDTDTGIYHPSANILAVVCGGFEAINAGADDVSFPDGVVATPGINFISMPSTGLFLDTSHLTIGVDGFECARFKASAATASITGSGSTQFFITTPNQLHLVGSDSGTGQILIEGNGNLADAIKLHATGGANQTIKVLNTAGSGAGAIKLEAAVGGIDIDSASGLTIDVSGSISLDATDDSNFKVNGSGKSLSLTAVGGGVQAVSIDSAGTSATSAITLTTTAGGISIQGMDETTPTNIILEDTAPASIVNVMNLQHTTTGTPAIGIGTGMTFTTETSAGNNKIGNIIESVTTAVGLGSEGFALVIKNMLSGAPATEKVRIQSQSGASSEPTLCFDNDLNTGIYSPGVSELGFSANGFERVRIVATATAAAPTLSFSGDTDTGIYRASANILGFTAEGGLANMTLQKNALTNDTSLLLGTGGNQSGVTIGALGEPRTGFSFPTTTTMQVSVAGTGANTAIRMQFSGTSDGITMQSGDSSGSSTQCLAITSDTGTTPTTPGIKIGTTGIVCALTRASAVAANSWEDGFFGNSAAMVFTPTDFVSNSGPRPISIGLTIPSGFRVAENSVNVTWCITQMIPKGFRINEDSVLTIWATDSQLPQWNGVTPTATIITKTLNGVAAATVTTVIGATALTINTLVYPSILTLALTGAPNVDGDGLTSIDIVFTPTVSLQASSNQGVFGASITMERV